MWGPFWLTCPRCGRTYTWVAPLPNDGTAPLCRICRVNEAVEDGLSPGELDALVEKLFPPSP